MTLNELLKKLSTIKKYRWFHVVYTSTINGYKKTTTSIVRFADYKKADGTMNEPKKTNLSEYIMHCENTGNTNLQVFVTNCKNHKPHSVYEYMGKEISKEEYYEGSHKKPSSPSQCFYLTIDNIVAIY